MDDEEVFELLINSKIKRLNFSWCVNRKEFIKETVQRLSINASIWKPDKYNLIFQLLLSFPFKINELEVNIAEAMQYIKMNFNEFCLEDLAVFKLFSKTYYPSLHNTISDVLTERFLELNDFSFLNFPEILTVTNSLTSDFKNYSNNENFTQKFSLFTIHVSDLVESNFEHDLAYVVEISFFYHMVPLKYSFSLQKILACKVYESADLKSIRISGDKLNLLLVLLKNINVSSSLRQFIMKRFLDFLGVSLFRKTNKIFSSGEMFLYERIFVTATDLKIFYPSFMINFFYNLKNKEHSAFGGRFGTEILASLAFFNFLETSKSKKPDISYAGFYKLLKTYALADINSVQQMILNLKKLEEPIKYVEMKRAIKMAWYCAIFDFKGYFEAKDFIEFINKIELEISIENYKKTVSIRNWIKYELRIEDTIILPKIDKKISDEKLILNEEDVKKREFKKEVKRFIADGFIEDYDLSGFIIDFANPETKEAIILYNENHYVKHENSILPLGNTIIVERVLRILGWKIEVLDEFKYLYSSLSFLKQEKIP